MKYIELSKGARAIVDDDKFNELNKHEWHLNAYGYAARKVELPRTDSRRKRKDIKMHHIVLKPKEGLYTDHINRDRLDNRRFNLRNVTSSQNNRNASLSARNTSGYKGVSWCKKSKRFRTSLYLDGKMRWKDFKDARMAALEYDLFVTEHFGEYALTNKKLGLI